MLFHEIHGISVHWFPSIFFNGFTKPFTFGHDGLIPSENGNSYHPYTIYLLTLECILTDTRCVIVASLCCSIYTFSDPICSKVLIEQVVAQSCSRYILGVHCTRTKLTSIYKCIQWDLQAFIWSPQYWTMCLVRSIQTALFNLKKNLHKRAHP